jgi:hypothetical protein
MNFAPTTDPVENASLDEISPGPGALSLSASSQPI